MFINICSPCTLNLNPKDAVTRSMTRQSHWVIGQVSFGVVSRHHHRDTNSNHRIKLFRINHKILSRILGHGCRKYYWKYSAISQCFLYFSDEKWYSMIDVFTNTFVDLLSAVAADNNGYSRMTAGAIVW